MKKIILLTIISFITLSCSKDDIKEDEVKCDCTKTYYKKYGEVYYINGLPKFRNKTDILQVIPNVGCVDEFDGVTEIKSGVKYGYKIECINKK